MVSVLEVRGLAARYCQYDSFKSQSKIRAALRLRLNLFACDSAGSVIPIFAMMVVLLLVIIGGAVDIARWANARSAMISAMDAAVLAAGRALEGGASTDETLAVARAYYDQRTDHRLNLDDDSIDFEVSGDKTTVTATGTARLHTDFLKFAGIDELEVFGPNEAPRAETVRRGANGTHREIAMMLDVSGSMSGANIGALRAGAKNFVNIVIKDHPGDYWTKVAIVPFSQHVYLPQEMTAVVMPPVSAEWPAFRDVSVAEATPLRPAGRYNRNICAVNERHGPQKFTDTRATPAAHYPTPNYHLALPTFSCFRADAHRVRPLSQDKPALLSAIDGLTDWGTTAGHAGTAWAYYMLSPQWAPILPADSRPAEYGTANVKKIAILMTDGVYNRAMDVRGFDASDRSGFAGISTGANGFTPTDQAVAICDHMKQDGIEIFAIGYNFEGDPLAEYARRSVSRCASDESHLYLPNNPEQLRTVFYDISIRLSDLHLAR